MAVSRFEPSGHVVAAILCTIDAMETGAKPPDFTRPPLPAPFGLPDLSTAITPFVPPAFFDALIAYPVFIAMVPSETVPDVTFLRPVMAL